jgi:periplasmic protein CpxP/Spy
MRNKLAILAGIGILAVAIAGGIARSQPTTSQNPPKHHHHMHGRMGLLGVPLPRLLRAANLTDAQKTQVRQIFKSNFATAKPQFEQMRAAQQQLAAKLWSSGTVTASDLSAPLAQITSARDQLAQTELNTIVSIRNLLSTSQLQGVAQAQKEFEARRAKWIASHKHPGAPAAESGSTPAP